MPKSGKKERKATALRSWLFLLKSLRLACFIWEG